ncbi:MAG: septation regulator SpoVG [bacterium]
MEITEVRVFPMNEDKLKAYATVTFDNCFVVRDLKIISGNSGLFVAMPSKKRKDGTFKDIAHPLNNDFRAKIEKVVLEAYDKEKVATPSSAQQILATPEVESKTPDQVNPKDYSAPDDE